MKLLVDLSNHNSIYSGVTIYTQRIISGFVKNGYKDVMILCHPLIYNAIYQSFPDYICLEAKQIKGFGVLDKIVSAYLQGKQINAVGCDVVFRPALSPSMLFTRCRVVQTIHDLQGLRINKGIKKWMTYSFMGMALLRSRHIITISNFVKEDIRRFYPMVSSKKIETIYNSVIVETAIGTTSPVAGNYLLYVSMIREYKNLITLLKAFNMIKDKIKQKLVVIGRPVDDYYQKVVVPYILANRLDRRIIFITEPVSYELLVQYYQHAELLVHPSLLEGFGYTPIEAAMLETPVLTSKETALYETTMGLLNYYEPARDYKILACRIKEVLDNPANKEELTIIAHTLSLQYDECRQARKVWECLVKTVNK